MDAKHTWSAGLFVAGVLIAVTAVVAAATKYPGPWKAPWFVACLIVAFGMLAGACVLLVSAQRSRPRLVFGEPFTRQRHVIYVGSKGAQGPPGHFVASLPPGLGVIPVTGADPSRMAASVPASASGTPQDIPAMSFAYVRVYNEVRRGRQSAEGVWAHVSFRRSGGPVLVEMDGRWADPMESQFEAPTIKAPEVQSIPANGNPHALDVAFKYIKDASCFAFNDENRVRSTDLRYRELPDSHTIVHVEVFSNAKTLVGEFDLLNDGEGSEPRLEPRSRHRTLRHPLAGRYSA